MNGAARRSWRTVFRDLTIQKKITIPFLILLGIIALVGTPLATDFVSSQIQAQAERDLESRAQTVQAYFEAIGADLSADVQSLGLHRDLLEALRAGNASYIEGLLIREKNNHGIDFALVYDTSGPEPRLVAADSRWRDPRFFSRTRTAAMAELEATNTEVVDISPALPEPDSVAASGEQPFAREPSQFALLAGAPVKDDTGHHGIIIAGRYLNPKLLFGAVRYTGGFREVDGHAVPRYMISFYAFNPDQTGKVVASSGSYDPERSTEEVVVLGGRKLPIARSTQTAACDTCHETAGGAAASLAARRLARSGVSHVSMSGGEYMVVHDELVMSGRRQGLFSILATTDEVTQAQRTARNGLLAGTTLLLVFIVAIGYRVSRAITQPIIALSRAAQAIADGQLEVSVPAAGRDEIGVLAQSISTMTDTLQENTKTIQSRLEEISLLYAFSSAAGSTLDLREILDTLLQSASRILGADSGSIMMVDRSGTELHLMACLEDKRLTEMEEKKIPLSEGIAGWVVQHRKPLVLPRDFAKHPELREYARGDVAASLCIPIQGKDAVLGVLNLNASSPEVTFAEETAVLTTALANQTAMAIDKAQLFEQLRELHTRVVRALGAAIDAKDRYTQGHSSLVAKYGVALGASLGLSDTELSNLEIAGYLHDIGKIGIYDEILQKEGRLSPEERDIIRTHPSIGATIIEPIGFSWDIVSAVRHHHEWWNGHGYPDGLKGRQIPLGARILAVVDSFEAMTAVRPYKPAMSFEEAWMEISRMAGIQFDPEMVEHFLAILDTLAATQSLAEMRA
ncbi:MAG: hypothetical protein Kow00122_15000 [Thermoleophilia bacterium]